MLFRTEVPINKSDSPIDYESKITSIGSCFSKHIGDLLSYYKFNIAVNPFGILFHCSAIKNTIKNAIEEKVYTEADIFFHNEQWHCFEAHSKLSHTSKENLINLLNKIISNTNEQLQTTTHLLITLGTAWVYKHKRTNQIVANCHKVPQKEFSKQLLSVAEITDDLWQIVELAKQINPKIRIVFTVSPVRHLKDGFIENQQSKSHLLTAVHQVLKAENTSYFPSYEIMMDELRDYRFYKEDMLHPNQTAINYIWEKFTNSFIADSVIPILKEVKAVQKALQHKPFNPKSEKHQLFLKSVEKKIETLREFGVDF